MPAPPPLPLMNMLGPSSSRASRPGGRAVHRCAGDGADQRISRYFAVVRIRCFVFFFFFSFLETCNLPNKYIPVRKYCDFRTVMMGREAYRNFSNAFFPNCIYGDRLCPPPRHDREFALFFIFFFTYNFRHFHLVRQKDWFHREIKRVAHQQSGYYTVSVYLYNKDTITTSCLTHEYL